MQVQELYRLNKEILSEIIKKDYRYSLMIDKPYIEIFTNRDIKDFETEIITIPLNKKIIDKFNENLDRIAFEIRGGKMIWI